MEFKLRCSQIGKVMTKPRIKSEVLSQTTKSYLEQIVKEEVYNTKYTFSSKYTDKGNIVEDNSIDFAAEMLGYGMLVKNEKYFNNDFLTGTPDVITKDTVLDLKNSWDCFTFPLFSDVIPNKDYMYQLQGYMALTGLKKARLVYVLSDTPTNLIEKEAYWFCKNSGFDDLDMDVFKEYEQRMTYKNTPNESKIKSFDIEYDETIIAEIYERVNLCRDYINELLNKIK